MFRYKSIFLIQTISYTSDKKKTCIKTRQLVFKCVLLDYSLELISVSYLFGKIIVIPIKTREAKKKRGVRGLTKKKGSFSNLKGHLTLPKPNPPLKTPRISATSFFNFDRNTQQQKSLKQILKKKALYCTQSRSDQIEGVQNLL